MANEKQIQYAATKKPDSKNNIGGGSKSGSKTKMQAATDGTAAAGATAVSPIIEQNQDEVNIFKVIFNSSSIINHSCDDSYN
jgi:hypothetical protein